MIKAVTFDLWDTLVHNRNYGEFRLPALKRILEQEGYSLNVVEISAAYLSGFRYSSQVIQSENHRHVMTHEIVDKVLSTLGLEDFSARDALVKMYEEAVLCDPPGLKEGVFEALDYAKANFKVGLVSVTGVSPGRIIRGILNDHGILHYFDALAFSDEVNWVKPNVKLFNAALEGLEVEPQETVHVGDSFKGDIIGAKDAGMRTIWVKTKEYEIPEDYKPDVVITSLLEFPEALKSLV
ncbi:MAG: HAD family hydrolase [Candidatus Bathyarchaeota archaeon]|nr:HAD family hydrolase [Candidatus Bathyarchaeota archaeon]